MNVSSFHIQHMIKAYGQRLGRGSLARMKLARAGKPSPDSIEISPEAKKKQLIHEIANDLVDRAKVHVRRNRQEDFEDVLFAKIGEKFKENIEIIPQKNRNSGFKFKVLDRDSKEKIEELSFEDLKSIIDSLNDDYESGETK